MIIRKLRKKPNATKPMIAALKRKLESDESSNDGYSHDEDIFKAELAEIKKKREALLRAMADLKELTSTISELKNEIADLKRRPIKEDRRVPTSSKNSEGLVDPGDGMISISHNIKLLPSQKRLLDTHRNEKTYTYTIMEMIWTRKILSTHSLTGKVSNAYKDKAPKPILDPSKVAELCDHRIK